MAEMIIQNPSITTNAFEYDEVGRVSAIAGHPLAGEGGGTIVKSDLMWKPNVGSDGYVRWTLASSATTPGEAYISGAQGPAGPTGPQGEQGPAGEKGDTGENGNDATPLTAATATIAGGTQVTISYTSGGDPLAQFNVLSGAQGASGTNGKDGISPTVSTQTITGGNRVTFTYDDGGTTKTESIDVMSGVSGAKGSDGFSPTVELTPIQDSQYPQGGWNVKITDAEHQAGQTFQVFNGIDGQGATVDLIGGTGIQVSHQAGTTDYTISVSADYAMKSYVDSASAYALSEAKTWVGGQGYLTSVPPEYALTSDIPTAVAQLTDSGNYYKKTETSGATEITNALNTKLDSTAAAQTYQTKSDMANYLTTSDASTTYQPKGNYASASDITDMATKTWVGGQGFLKNTDLTDYATKTYANEASANALTQAESWVETEGYIKSVPDISGNNGLSANGHTVGINNTGIDANKQYAWTTTGWQLVSVPTIPDITANNGLSANGHTVGISTTNIDANKQYAWTTTGWASVETAYLPLTGGTVSGQLIVSATSANFDSQYLKLIREGVNGYGRIGLGSGGPLALKVDDANSHTTQINISPNATNDQLVQVQHGGTTAYLIPAQIHQGSYTPSENDGILHIIVEN